jgi:hypothetical protein
MFFYTRGVLYAVRSGPHKLHMWAREPVHYGRPPIKHDPPLLYHLEHDPSEVFDIAAKNPSVVGALQKLASEHERGVESVPDQLAIPLGK